MSNADHVTTRDRALQILAHGFAEQEVAVVGVVGIRLLAHLLGLNRRDVEPKGRNVVDPDLRAWEPVPVNRIHDPLGSSVLEVTFDESTVLDDWRILEEAVLVRDHRSQTAVGGHLQLEHRLLPHWSHANASEAPSIPSGR